jgi:hypothetical protein
MEVSQLIPLKLRMGRDARDNRKKAIAQGTTASIKDIISRFHHSPKRYFGQDRFFPITLEEDEENIQKYWANSQLDRITTDPAITSSVADGQHNIFSAHPPFNFVIVYGVEESGLSPVGVTDNMTSASMEQRDNLDRIISTDINERKVKMSNQKTPMKIVLQNVHLLNMSTEYQSGGAPLIETYSFVARDFYLTEAQSGFNPYTGKAFVSSAPESNTSAKAVVESPLVNRTDITLPR